MKTIFKYHVTQGANVLSLPRGSEIISAINQSGNIMVYAITDTHKTDHKYYSVYVVGTGWALEDVRGKFLSTVCCGMFVWHLFVDEED